MNASMSTNDVTNFLADLRSYIVTDTPLARSPFACAAPVHSAQRARKPNRDVGLTYITSPN